MSSAPQTPLSDSEMRDLLRRGQFWFSAHALKRVVERNTGRDAIMEAGASAEVIEDYPDDKYSPSCLLLGWTAAGYALHMHVSRA